VFAGKKSAQIREILISESAWEEMTCLFAPSLALMFGWRQSRISNYENGTRKPNLNDCRRIVEKFNELGSQCTLDSVFPPILPKE